MTSPRSPSSTPATSSSSTPTACTTAATPEARALLEAILQQHQQEPARDICEALMEFALQQDEVLRANGDEALIDDKTVFVVKRT